MWQCRENWPLKFTESHLRAISTYQEACLFLRLWRRPRSCDYTHCQRRSSSLQVVWLQHLFFFLHTQMETFSKMSWKMKTSQSISVRPWFLWLTCSLLCSRFTYVFIWASGVLFFNVLHASLYRFRCFSSDWTQFSWLALCQTPHQPLEQKACFLYWPILILNIGLAHP